MTGLLLQEHITIWKEGKITKIETEEVRWVHSMRFKNDYTVEILIDPWCPNSAIWEVDMNTLKFTKVRDFEDYKDSEYSLVMITHTNE